MKTRSSILSLAWLAAVLCFLIVRNALAADPSALFDEANKLHEQGKFAEALAVYDQLVENKTVSPAIYFNRGNTLFRMNQLGRAIASYTKAQQLSPRDSDIRSNLKYARSQVRNQVGSGSSFWSDRISRFTLNEWAILVAFNLWCLFALLAAHLLRPDLKATTKTPIAVFAALLLFTGFCLASKYRNRYSIKTAIVTQPQVIVHNGPLEVSPTNFTVTDGTELTVTDKKDDWLQVSDRRNQSGWLKTNQVLVLN